MNSTQIFAIYSQNNSVVSVWKSFLPAHFVSIGWTHSINVQKHHILWVHLLDLIKYWHLLVHEMRYWGNGKRHIMVHGCYESMYHMSWLPFTSLTFQQSNKHDFLVQLWTWTCLLSVNWKVPQGLCTDLHPFIQPLRNQRWKIYANYVIWMFEN